MKLSVHPNGFSNLYLLALCLVFAVASTPGAHGFDNPNSIIVPPPDVTITCDFWFPYNSNNPDQYVNEYDSYFGAIINGTSNRDKVIITDRVCPAHPRFSEFAPASPFDDPCYDDTYNINWGLEGYSDNFDVRLLIKSIDSDLRCNRGVFTRRWHKYDIWQQPVATQRITIIDCKEFYVPTACWRFTPRDVGTCDFIAGTYLSKLIEWPCDVVLSRCGVSGVAAFEPDNLDISFDQDREPRFDDDRCSMIASSYEDQTFTFVDSSCQKIFRTWHVIDWCLYEDFQDGVYFGDFEWEWLQVIKLQNVEAPVWVGCQDTTFCGYGDPNNPNNDQCVGDIKLRPTVSDDCTKNDLLNIDYKIDLFNDGTADLFGYSANQGPVYPFPNPDNLPVSTFQDTVNADGIYPVGTHKILWAAEDGCGNTTSCTYLFTVEDCKPPTVYCETGVSTIPMPLQAGGFIDIWASDFILSTSNGDNCTPFDDLVYSFSDDPSNRSIRRTCDDVTGVPERLTIYTWDLDVNGLPKNFATCEVTLLLSDCGQQGMANVAGSITIETGEPIANVTTTLINSQTSETEVSVVRDGGYAFFDVPDGDVYQLSMAKDTNHLNGVSTYDMIVIARHILGYSPIRSPYKMLAADVNNSNSLTAYDMVEIRKLVLWVNDRFTNAPSWKFIPADTKFNQPADAYAFPLPDTFDLAEVQGELTTNYIGIKTGDLDYSARINGLIGAEDRTGMKTVNLLLEEQLLVAGKPTTISVRMDEVQDFLGGQWTLSFDKNVVDIEDIAINEASGLQDVNLGLRFLSEGKILVSWDQALEKDMDEETVLFDITVRAKESANLSEVIELDEALIKGEIYQALGTEIIVDRPVLEFTKATVATANFEVFPVQPNPFSGKTQVSFSLPESDQVSIELFTLAGQSVWSSAKVYDSGMHQVDLFDNYFNDGTVFIIKVESSTGVNVEKIMRF